VSEIRSDAFIVRTDDIHLVTPQTLNMAELEFYSKVFLDAIETEKPRNYPKALGEKRQVLRWLWDVAVKSCP
jgi:hypothetical protein